jgi:hypothetical protein
MVSAWVLIGIAEARQQAQITWLIHWNLFL